MPETQPLLGTANTVYGICLNDVLIQLMLKKSVHRPALYREPRQIILSTKSHSILKQYHV